MTESRPTNSKQPTILFVTPHFGRELGGVGSSAERIVCGLRSQWNVVVVQADRTLSPNQVVALSEVGLVQLRVGLHPDSKRAGQDLCDLVIQLSRTHAASVICAFYLGQMSYSATVAAQILAVPLIACARGNDIDLEIFGSDAFQLQHTLRHAAVVTCVSREMEAKVRAWSPEASAQFVPNGVDPVAFPPPVEHLVRTPGRLQIGLFGEIKAKKGFSLLLEAIHPLPVALKVVGRLDDEMQKLLHGTMTLYPDLQTKITVVPFVKRATELLQEFHSVDVVAIPSLHEGMPNVLLEAMSCERVVVASEVGGSLDVISHGENGFLFPRGDAQQLQSLLHNLCGFSAQDRQTIGQRARQRVIDHFDWRREMCRYLEIFAPFGR